MASMDTWIVDIPETNNRKSINYSPKIVNKSLTSKYLKVDVKFEHFVQKVIENKYYGIIKEPIELVEVSSSCGKLRGDRLKFAIPYAGKVFTCTALFNSLCPEIGPDFEFSDKTFLQDPEIQVLEKYVPGFINWDNTDSESLIKVLGQFITYYKQHQIDKLGLINERLEASFTNLREKIDTSDIELILLPDVNNPIEAHIIIRINLNFTKFIDKFTSFNNEVAMLHVVFHGPSWIKGVPQLLLSSKLLDLFNGTYRIQPLTSIKVLGTYILDLKRRLNDKMLSIVKNYMEKKEFVTGLLLVQGKSLIEYDSEDFSFITIMLDHEGFHYLVYFKLTDNYPDEAPIIKLQSIYHLYKNEPIVYPVEGLTYSKKCDSFECVTKTLAHIDVRVAEGFKQLCIRLARSQ
ncbi:hypothetical protein HCN44_003871 [Aphidius gifuensis]|uniref:BRISC and BRCA1-A complex member 2 n=1 Tax=Aphidius gifuensis TaxID=684658 RepID=A0A835CSW9_APHGI|nr:BRISC and BRCA1-A complex member 2-like [Aphidius gifuensis]KAF7994399.1 hypothetical protein HCN44_003871 [Aphidius gifuensis]